MAYTNIDDPSAYFQTLLHNSSGNTAASYTFDGNSEMQPDLVWHKNRTYVDDHYLFDSTRGVENALYSNKTNAETNHSNSLTSFDSNGYSVGSSNVTSGAGTYASWCWKANAGSTSSNTDGSITSTVQANTNAGFSIVTYTGNSTSGATFGHGLGVAPSMVIVKKRSATPLADIWGVWHQGLTSAAYYLLLNSTAAQANSWNIWNSTAPSSSLVTLGNDSTGNYNGQPYVAYCFAKKQGFSNFGKYTGTGEVNGPFVYTGFAPAFVMIKNASASESWVIYDTARNTYNVANLKLSPNSSDSENGNAGIGGAAYNNIDILSNGFKCRTNNAATNGIGNTIIYMAFAENPFVTSTGVPCTAR